MNIYVGNLAYAMKDDELAAVFGEYGKVDAARIIMDRETGRSKGFGFVEMSDASEANAAIEALSGNGNYSSNMQSVFLARRNLLVEGIKSIPLLDCNKPEATFYLMVNISGTGMKSEQFAVELLKAVHVAVVPGVAYGRTCDDYVRMAFTISDEKIKEGLKRIRLFTESLL